MTSESGDEEKDVLRSKIETLILITGLVMMPYVYLWQQSLTMLDANTYVWNEYLNSTLGSQYNYRDVIASYFTPFALLRALPIDLWILCYDFTFVLSVVAVMILGVALVAVEEFDVGRVQKLVDRGRTCLMMVLLAIIFFAAFHLLTTILFPLKLLLGLYFAWTVLGISLVSTIIVLKLFRRSIIEILGTDFSSITVRPKRSKTSQVDSKGSQ